MTSEQQKTVLVGISGCIAAYKAAEIVRGLQKAGVRVKVVMTDHATHFVDPLTFRALTNEPVGLGLFDDPQDPIHHISLAQEADLFLIAPCTANVMAKVAHGIADDLLTTTALATTAPVMIAPAMNVHMYKNPITQDNIARLKSFGLEFIEPDAGYLACGEVGQGRLPEPEDIVAAVLQKLEGAKTSSDSLGRDLAGKRIMVTAGPTVEAIDPVRYITNRSSGKFGYAIAEAAARRGAQVTLVSGPVALAAPQGVEVISVESAREMLEAAKPVFEGCDVGIFSAAVADVRPAQQLDKKLKKGINDAELQNIALVENPDVLATLGNAKQGQLVVGFAAETNDVLDNARKKLTKKNADMIVANEVGSEKVFGKDDDEVWLVTASGEEHLPSTSKRELADMILDKIVSMGA
ncbi:bifunctional phosphopantothenoylcysteine decarboxylase/phosphopantothenate--cysteine ligase CoaBC [Anaerotardibacter muris]|uniref:bifunctional phosphopantothenoylcysteine decarboxylase/phosphopantothenate--cysteine ligase CoaBC n=1 Tax=Anaerotardibacter muris TaxID=2941505 RepID=UPI00203EB923|nr:bifunctional phosphopantothenoylcysteine decarboxylase/phosphopantothenate--cysteine ligase CoaBC [Anaerotardibacter muris]